MRGKCFELCVDSRRNDALGHQPLRDIGHVRDHRRDAEGGDAEASQGQGHRTGDAAGVIRYETVNPGAGGKDGAINECWRLQFVRSAWLGQSARAAGSGVG